MKKYTLLLVVILFFSSNVEAKGQVYNLPPHQEMVEVFKFIGLHKEGVTYQIYWFDEKYTNQINKLFRWKSKDTLIHEQLKDIIKDIREWYALDANQKKLLKTSESKFYKNYKYYYEMRTKGLAYTMMVWFEKENELHLIYRAY